MSEQEQNPATEQPSTGGLSRRNALKAGVAVGVGMAAWSGPTITSLGGTPAYAAGCTFVIDRTISGDDRNTDQGCPGKYGLRYHELPFFSNMPDGFSMFNPQRPAPNTGGWNSGVCNDTTYNLVLTYPSELDCDVHVVLTKLGDPAGPHTFTNVSGAPVDQGNGFDQVTWHLPTATDLQATGKDVDSSTQYRILLRCISDNADPSCLN